MLATLLMTAILATHPAVTAPAAAAERAPGAAASPVSPMSSVVPLALLAAPAGGTADWLTRFLGDEDLLMLFQIFAGLGLASALGVMALVPAHAVLLALVIVAVMTSTPALVLVGPVLMAGMVMAGQALGAGLAVWLVSLTADRFRARGYTPDWVKRAFKELGGIDVSQGIWPAVLGVPWLTGFGGYLVGACLGVAGGVALTLPLLAAALVLVRAPAGNVPGVFALLGALALGGLVVAASETLVAPVMAAVAHHLTKEPVTAAPAAQ